MAQDSPDRFTRAAGLIELQGDRGSISIADDVEADTGKINGMPFDHLDQPDDESDFSQIALDNVLIQTCVRPSLAGEINNSPFPLFDLSKGPNTLLHYLMHGVAYCVPEFLRSH